MISVRHVGIVCADLRASLDFYQLLGFRVSRRIFEHGDHIDHLLGVKGIKVDTVKLTSGDGTMIELLEFRTPWLKQERPRALWDIGLSHIALTVPDIEAEHQHLMQQSVRFISAPILSPDGTAKVCFMFDPDNIAIELVENVTCLQAA